MVALCVQVGIVPVLGSDWIQVVVVRRNHDPIELSLGTLTKKPRTVPEPVVWQPWVRWLGRTPRPF